MKNIIERINAILSDWDPLNVGEEISFDEYKGYVPIILKNIKDKDQLTTYLENILTYDLQTGYDKMNIEHRNSLDNVVERLMKVVFE